MAATHSHVEKPHVEASGLPGEPPPSRNRQRIAAIRKTYAPAEEWNDVAVRSAARVTTSTATTTATTTTATTATATTTGRVTANVQEAQILEEELPLLREEEAEPRQVDLLIVGLHLRKVRIDRDVQGELRSDAQLEIQPSIHLVQISRGGATPLRVSDDERLDLEIPALLNTFDPLERAGDRRLEDSERSRSWRPLDPLVPVARDPLDVEAPRLGGCLVEPQGLEGNRKLG